MSRPPLSRAKVRRARLVLAVVTVVVAAGSAVDVATGHGVWIAGIIGWLAIVLAVGLGAGAEASAAIVGLGAWVVRWRRRHDADGPRNDAEWS